MDVKAFGWLPVVVICLFISIFRAGLGPIPWFMIAEVLPTEVKPWATSAVVCYTWLCTFLVTKSFLVVVDTLGFSYTYLMMSSVATVGLLFFLYCVPETKNRTPQEIRELISRNKRYMKIHGIIRWDSTSLPFILEVIPVSSSTDKQFCSTRWLNLVVKILLNLGVLFLKIGYIYLPLFYSSHVGVLIPNGNQAQGVVISYQL